MAKEIVQGQVADLGIGYEIKVEDGQLKVSGVIDIVALLDKGEKALPEGTLKPYEVALIELVKTSVKNV